MFTLIVPKNEKGIQNCEIGKDDVENVVYFELSVEEYENLRRHKVFDILNNQFDLWIDEGEEETVTADELKEVFNQITPLRGKWLEAIEAAINWGTRLYLVF